VIVGYLDLLQDGTFGACDPETGPVFDKLRANAAYLLELAEEFLDLSRLEAESEPGRHQTVDPVPLLRELADWFSLLVRDQPVAFEANIPPGLPMLAAEGAKLRVIVQNLLSNAAKFTREGRIRLAAAILADGLVAIRVSDTGPGIAAEHHEAVFDMFRQLGPRVGRREGAGLGLALARRFARLMGGDISVESALGQGATFTVVLLAATGAPTAPAGHAS
jgi:signal transduction histidine kinase